MSSRGSIIFNRPPHTMGVVPISHLQFSHGQNDIEIFSKILYFHAKIAKIASVDFTDKIREIEQKNLANFWFFFQIFIGFKNFWQQPFCRNFSAEIL